MAITKKTWNEFLNMAQRNTISELYWKTDERKREFCKAPFHHNFNWTRGQKKECVGAWIKEMLGAGKLEKDGTVSISGCIVYQDGTYKEK